MRKKRIILLSVVMLAIGAGVFGLRYWRANPLAGREARELKSVEVSTLGVDSGASRELPEEEWGAMLKNFATGRPDSSPLKWQGLASVTFEFNDGSEIFVTVFHTGEEPGAFQIGGKYYRGGQEEITRKLMSEMR